MLCICEHISLFEYIYTPPSERTEEEKKRIKYASIKKREKLRSMQPPAGNVKK
jgi:hypothetical protein